MPAFGVRLPCCASSRSSVMKLSTMLILGVILPAVHVGSLGSVSGVSANRQDGVPESALRAYLLDRVELLGRSTRVMLCAGITSRRNVEHLAKELATAVELIDGCSSAQGGIVRDAPGETLVLERFAVAGDTLLLTGYGTRRPIADTAPIEFVTWGERVALHRAGTSNSWFVSSITLTGVARAMQRRRPRAPAGGDSTAAVDATRAANTGSSA